MKLENRCTLSANKQAAWDVLLDIPRTAACVPGVQAVTPEGEGRYRANLRVKVGPMSLNLSGLIQLLEQDKDKGEARFQVEASDRRVGGSVRSEMLMQLLPQSEAQTELVITSDTTFMGKLGELGQPIIRRKASSTLDEFARNLSREFDHPAP